MKLPLPVALLLSLPTLPGLAQNLTNTGTTLTLTGGAVLSVGGSLTNAAGTLNLSSGSNQLYVGGNLVNAAGATLTPGTTSVVTLNGTASQELNLQGGQLANLTINNTSGGVTVPATSNAEVTGSLTLTNGMVTVDPTSALRLLNGATLRGEQAGRYVRGPLVAVRSNVPGGAATAFANGFTLTPTATLTNLAVTRRAGLQEAQVSYGTNSSGANKGIDRIWATSVPVTGAVQLSWVADDDNGLTNFSQAQVWARTAAPVAGSDWGRIGSPQNGSGRSAGGSLPDGLAASYFTVSTATAPLGSQPLPVTLVRFTAERQGDGALLRWTTASEVNNERFEVEVSTDGTAFRRLAAVAGQGTSYQAHEYQLLDPGLLGYGTDLLYYRLRQVDQDGTSSYSSVRTVLAGARTLALFPNPTTGAATLTGAQPGALVTVLDALGRLVMSVRTTAAGTAILQLPAGHATGMYVVRTGSQALRLTVE